MHKGSAGILFVVALLASAAPTLAQIREVPLAQRIDEATIIVEGRVVDSASFHDPQGTRIFTEHRIHVYKMFKSHAVAGVDAGEIRLITPGGRIGDELHVVTPSLALRPGDTGLFFVEARSGYAGKSVAYLPVASLQGFVRYRPESGDAADPFRRYGDIPTELYAPIQQRTGELVRVIDRYEPPRSPAAGTRSSHTIGGFSPGTVRAGVQEVLTINGSGFGAFTGAAAVLFDNADDGKGGAFGAASSDHIVSWSDTQIEVLVPNATSGVSAGTGQIVVRDSAGAATFSASDLTVEYALTEVLSGGSLFRVSMENENGRGGYTYRYSTSTANNGVDFTTLGDAMDRFEEALALWNCEVGWNADVDGTTTVQAVGNDGVNIAAFDSDADPLPGGVLGRANSFYSGCGGDTWYLNGVDIRFKRDGTGGADWYFGASPAGQGAGEDDFMSVALHELGHNAQHGHINDSSDVMHWSSTTGTSRRSLSLADVAGGADIVGHSSSFGSCGTTGMLAFDCAVAPTANFAASPLGTCGSSLSVDFTDLSLNGPTAWSWTFGDSGVSGLRNPTHDYTTQGIYSVSLEATNGNGSDTLDRDHYVVVTDAPATASCDPTFAGHNDCCGIGILNVTLGSIDNSTGSPSDGDPLQEDFTCSQLTVLEPDTSYPISVTTGPANDEDVRVYVDWNDDGTLSAGELAFSSDDATAHAGSIDVPAGAVTGTALRLRVLSDFFPQGILSACENIEYGQVEDYSVLVAAAAAPPGEVPETSLLLDKNASPGLLDLSWSPSCSAGAADYSIHEGLVGSWYSHTEAECSTSSNTFFNGFMPDTGNRYYLIVPLDATDEGGYGSSSTMARPRSSTTCRTTQDATVCP